MDNLPREKLGYIVKTYGKGIYENPRQVEALLKDYCGSYRKEINAIICVLKECDLSELLICNDKKSYNTLSNRLVFNICKNVAMSEEAVRWALDAWAIAFNIITPLDYFKSEENNQDSKDNKKYQDETNKVKIEDRSSNNREISLNTKDKNTNIINGKYGNTSANIVNEGFVAVQGDWIIYTTFGESGSLYKVNINNLGTTMKLNTGHSRYINIINDTIYYGKLINKNGYILCKMNINGGIETKLVNDYVECVNVIDEWIYYINTSDNNKIYKVKIDGSCRTQICNDSADYINVLDNWIYYCNNHSVKYGYETRFVYNLFRVMCDGSNHSEIKLPEPVITKFIVKDNWIYYMGNFGNLNKIKTDGSSYMTIWERICDRYFNITEDWIFCTHSILKGIRRMNHEGRLLSILDVAEGGGREIAIFGDYIYYYITKTIKKGFLSRIKETNLVRIKIDGTNKTILS